MEAGTFFLDILAQFGGGRGEPLNNAPRFLLASFFWIVLGGIAYYYWRKERNRRDLLVFGASMYGLFREVLMFIIQVIGKTVVIIEPKLHTFYPPLEHMIDLSSGFVIAYAFMRPYGERDRSDLFGRVSITGALFIYLISAVFWPEFLRKHPDATFGAFWGDLAFRLWGTLCFSWALGYFIHLRQKGKDVSRSIVLGLCFFMLDHFLMIINLLQGEVNREVFAPIRHNLHIWAIPVFIIFYWKQTQKLIRQQEFLSRIIFRTSPVGLILADKEGKIIMASPSTKRVLGYRGTLIQKDLRELDVDLEDIIHPQERQYSYSSGQIRYIRWRVAKVPGGGYVAIAEDITRRKLEMEELLRAERYKTLETLIGGIAHDINNMIVGLSGSVGLLKRRLSNEKRHQNLLEAIERSSQRVINMVQSLMAYTRAGIPSREPVDIKSLIEDVVELCFKGKPHKVSIEISPALLNAHGDQTKLSQVLINLLINAQEATDPPGQITVKAENYEPGQDSKLPSGQYLHITVSDTGRGIPEEHIDRIFDPFFTTKEKGTGLGLAISKQIIEAHNGAIHVESTPGKGTTFHLYIPATKEEPSKQPEQLQEDLTFQGAVIIYDDEEIVKEILSEMLTTMGFEVVTTGSSQKCIEEISNRAKAGNPYKLAFLDVTVYGDRSGFELIGNLKLTSPETKFVVMSGYMVESPEEHGFDGVLQKPFKFEQIQSLLRRVLL